ncbi:MAG: class I SAM-dependent methyltransferase [Candidatus Hydrogenedentota bacterium]|nr:MAG: class I SAM-dependent methyltransferase [Candidatus Hydrogenedentota bacterium]
MRKTAGGDVAERKKIIRTVQERFEEEAETYWRYHYGGEAPYPGLAYRRIRILEMMGPEPGKVLDVGCGPGALAEDVVERGGKWIGIDFAEGMLQTARDHLRKKGVAVVVARAAAEMLPFRARQFDTVVAAGVLEYLPGYRGALREMKRVLRSGGRLILSMPHRDCLARKPYEWLWGHSLWRGLGRRAVTILNRIHESEARKAPVPSYYHRATKRELEELLRREGFRMNDCAFFHFHLLPAPLEEYFPGPARWLGEPLERFSRTRLGILASGLVVCGVKDV